MNRRIVLLISLVVLASTLAACSSATPQPAAQVITSTPTATSAPAAFPLTLKDDLGRKVTLPAAPSNVSVSLHWLVDGGNFNESN